MGSYDGSPNQLATTFVTQYYATFDADRSQCANFYHDQSQMLFEGQLTVGRQAIGEKLASLPFKTVQHAVTTVDALTNMEQCVTILVNGQLKTDEDRPLPFTQTFYIRPMNNSWFVDIDMFRLGVHNM